MPKIRHIGDTIRLLRKMSDMKLEDVGEIAKLSRPYLSEIENGKNTSLHSIEKITEALDISLADFFAIHDYFRFNDTFSIPKFLAHEIRKMY